MSDRITVSFDETSDEGKCFLKIRAELTDAKGKFVSNKETLEYLINSNLQLIKGNNERDAIIQRIPEFKKSLCEMVAEIIWDNGQKIIVTSEAVENKINELSKK